MDKIIRETFMQIESQNDSIDLLNTNLNELKLGPKEKSQENKQDSLLLDQSSVIQFAMQ